MASKLAFKVRSFDSTTGFIGVTITGGSTEPTREGACGYCGRPLRSTIRYEIVGVGSWEILAPVSRAGALCNRSDYMGYLPVGPCCGGRLKTAIRNAGLDPKLYLQDGPETTP